MKLSKHQLTKMRLDARDANIPERVVRDVYNKSINDSINLDKMTATNLRIAFNRLYGNLWVALNLEYATKQGMKIE